MVRRIASLIAGLTLIMSGCSQVTVQATPTILPTGLLTPYQTLTPSPVLPRSTIKVTIPATPTPTATPFIYTVKGEDTMLGIAYQFGISLQNLQAANPEVDPHFMGEGLKLIIPINQEIPETLPTPTPLPVQANQPN